MNWADVREWLMPRQVETKSVRTHRHLEHDLEHVIRDVHRVEREQLAIAQAILTKLENLFQQGEKIMSKAEDIAAKLDEIDTTTNEVAADIDKLLAAGFEGLTAAEAQAVVDRLTAHSDTLKAVAAKS